MAHRFYPEVLPSPQAKVWSQLKNQSSWIRKHGFYLAGGTALALQLGHRQSVDFDFFSRKKKTGVDARSWLEGFSKHILREADADTVHGEISGVKVSLIGAYAYPLAGKFITIDGVNIANTFEIALMKLLAITHRATLRDYIDLAAVLERGIGLHELLQGCRKKYGKNFNILLPLRSLVSFDDLDAEMPVLLDKSLASSWKKILRQAVREIS